MKDDQELMLIERLLTLIKSAQDNMDIGPVEVARAVEYVAERCYQARDEHQREIAEEEAEDRAEEIAATFAAIRERMSAAAEVCECENCRARRNKRFDA